MSEQEDWNEEIAPPPKKKGFPGWLMFCGGGCLIAMILGAIGAFFVVGEVKKAMDPEVQWANLEESIEMDARPPELNLMFGWSLGIKFWMFMDDRGYIAVIYDFGESEAEGREELFSESFTGAGVPGLSKIEDPEVGAAMVQGREIAVVRFMNKGGFNAGSGSSVDGQGAACFIDMTPEGDAGFQMTFLMRDPNAKNAKDPISDEAIVTFLEPFVMGPEHVPYLPSEGPGMDYSEEDELEPAVESAEDAADAADAEEGGQ